jgi:hypothetical protein
MNWEAKSGEYDISVTKWELGSVIFCEQGARTVESWYESECSHLEFYIHLPGDPRYLGSTCRLV